MICHTMMKWGIYTLRVTGLKKTASLDWHLHYKLINRLPDPYTVHMDKNLYVIGVAILQVKQFG